MAQDRRTLPKKDETLSASFWMVGLALMTGITPSSTK